MSSSFMDFNGGWNSMKNKNLTLYVASYNDCYNIHFVNFLFCKHYCSPLISTMRSEWIQCFIIITEKWNVYEIQDAGNSPDRIVYELDIVRFLCNLKGLPDVSQIAGVCIHCDHLSSHGSNQDTVHPNIGANIQEHCSGEGLHSFYHIVDNFLFKAALFFNYSWN